MATFTCECVFCYLWMLIDDHCFHRYYIVPLHICLLNVNVLVPLYIGKTVTLRCFFLEHLLTQSSLFLLEQRLCTSVHHLSLHVFWAKRFTSHHVSCVFSNSAILVHVQLCWGVPLLCFPCGFYSTYVYIRFIYFKIKYTIIYTCPRVATLV